MPQLNSYALKLKNNLQEKDPELYRNLKKSGELDKFCRIKGESAAQQMDDLMRAGMRDFQAKEIVIKDLFDV